MSPRQSVRHVAVLSTLLSLAVAAAGAKALADGKDAKSKDSDKRPKIILKAQPVVAISPAKITLKAELAGGANDYEEFYCPTVEWDWGDGTKSEATSDCEPYQPGKSELRRHYSVDHVFRAGIYQVAFRLKRHEKVVASAMTAIQIQAGIDELQR